ncbi:MAG: spore germination protein, partial [Firmicutes bacterium]|nr:spore germination protein [Bacillota bacterium]
MNDDFKMKNDFKINSKQLTFFMFAAILEIDSLTTFGWLTKLAGPDAWLAIVFALVLIAPGTTLIALLGRRFPRESIIEYSQRTFGRLIGILIGLFYAGFWTLMAAKVLRQNTDLVNTFLLFRTPREAVMLIMLITVAYLIRNGLTPITKLNVFLFPLMFLPLAVSAFLSLRDFDYTNFFPFLTRGIRPVLEGALLVAGAFQGLE